MTKSNVKLKLLQRSGPEQPEATQVMADSTQRNNSAGKDRVLLLLDSADNRDDLTRQLVDRHQIMLPTSNVLNEAFDLAVIDMAGFVRWNRQLREARDRAHPILLPVILLISQADLARSLLVCRELVDEFLIIPVESDELTQRMGKLLQARNRELAQRGGHSAGTAHDCATGLPQKTLFLARLGDAVQSAAMLSQELFVVVVRAELDYILKSLGYRTHELASAKCSELLQTVVPERLSLASLNAGNWALILGHGATLDNALQLCHKIQSLVTEPVVVDGERIHFRLGTGISLYPDSAATAEDLLDSATSALGHMGATASPGVFSARAQQQELSRIRTLAGLYEAVKKEQFEVCYQPQVQISDGHLVGVEALVRWRLPNGELVNPGQFVPVAEASGLITAIDRYVLEEACNRVQAWKRQGHCIPRLGVNISAHHLDAGDFVATVKTILQRTNLEPSTLELELTETSLADLREENLYKLKSLREFGVGIALDDFGTGYCSLNYLHALPVTTIKIDQSFVARLMQEGTDAMIVQCLVTLSKKLKLRFLAEGIETDAQAQCLKSMNVKIGQGFLYARPMASDALYDRITCADQKE